MKRHLKSRPKIMDEIMLKLHMLDNDLIETMIYIQSILSAKVNLYNI